MKGLTLLYTSYSAENLHLYIIYDIARMQTEACNYSWKD